MMVKIDLNEKEPETDRESRNEDNWRCRGMRRFDNINDREIVTRGVTGFRFDWKPVIRAHYPQSGLPCLEADFQIDF
jgi:hypothetical protein